ncbi:Phosphatidylinositol 5-phosphate 4-kinase type-2 alpha [Mortierella sp. AD094]|nr:Phosphatidylinositol 5-phosphate 4-kinase type-2 alpha [Mortierella sp. AD094]
MSLFTFPLFFSRSDQSPTPGKEDGSTDEKKVADAVTSESQQKPNTIKSQVASPNLTRSLKAVESDPLSASNVNIKTTKKPAEGYRKPRSNRGSLRSLRNRNGLLVGGAGVTGTINRPETAPVNQKPTPLEPDTIPIDAESRWRDYHIKRQLAQSLLMESMEPVLSRHLRHAIKSVLHFTSVGPETMDLKAASQGLGHWDSLMAPVILPLKAPVMEGDGPKQTQGTGGNYGLRASALSRSITVASTKVEDLPTIVSTSPALSPVLEPPLPVGSPNDQLSRSTSLRKDTAQYAAGQSDHPRPTSPPIIVRGFSSSSTHTRFTTADEDSPIARTEESHTASVSKTRSRSPQPEESEGQGIFKVLNAPAPPPKGMEISLQRFGSPTAAQEAEIVETLNSEEQIHLQQLQPQSRSSRLWTRVRRVVQGDFKQNDPPSNTVYLTAGSVAGAARSVLEAHLPSRPLSTSSTESSNAAMPSFSSSALSLLSEDQMSPQMGPTIRTSNLKESMAFETPPETAANTPRPISPVSPTSPTFPIAPLRSRSSLQQNLPGLSRRSSTKSPAAAAEVTTAESKVSQFMYSDKQLRSDSGSGVNVSHANTGGGNDRQQDPFSTPNALERSTFKSAIQISSCSEVPAKSPPRAIVTNNPLGRSRSTSDAQHRGPYRQRHQTQEQSKGNLQDFDQLLATNSLSQEFGMLSPQSDVPSKSLSPLGQQRERTPSSNSTTKGGAMRVSITPYQSTDSGSMSPSQLLSGTSSTLLPSKEERRKSAISFGGYFSSTAEAARKSRNHVDHSVAGLEMDTKGEVIHLRRTSFFDKASPPALTSLVSLLQTNLPSLSQSMAGPGSPSLSRSPSKASDLAQDQRYSHSRRASAITVIGPEDSDASRHLAAITASKAMGGSAVTGGNNARERRKKVTPLKITPPLLSGLPSMPSPMFQPLSATIPRPLTSMPLNGATLDRYFFNADQVHEWNIPSYGRVKFIDHAPLVFQAIRERFNYTLADMDEALSQPMTVMKTPGKSDAIFFASHNHGRFLLKTLRGAEPENLKGFLSDYLGHIQKHPNTLLPRYLGMYTFERVAASKILGGVTGQSNSIDGVVGGGGISGGGDKEHGFGSKMSSKSDAAAAQHLHLNGTLLSGKDDGLPSKVVVVVLANVFDTPELINERYDFKGSNVGRRTLPVNRAMATRDKPLGGQEMYQRADLGRSSTELDSHAAADLTRRRSRRGDPALRESRASFTQYDPRREHSHCGNVEDMPTNVGDEISNLTLKEMDFQDRIYTGETRLIHLGPTRRSEMLAQLEEDTSLLRKHGFMDYSMLVGIRLVPKAPEPIEEHHSSSSSSADSLSRRGSISSRGSDADNSNDEEEEDLVSLSGSVKGKKTEIKGEFSETLDRFWYLIDLSRVLREDQMTFLKEISDRAQETLRTIGEGMGAGLGIGNGHKRFESSQSSKNGQQKPPSDVELGPVSPSRPHARDREDGKKKSRKNRAVEESVVKDELFDPESFQTVRCKPRDTQEAESHASRRPIFPGVGDITGAAGAKKIAGEHQEYQQKHQHSHDMAESPPSGQFLRFDPSSHEPHLIWSQGIPSEQVPDGYEAVYYFGLIDTLQKYNMFKWFERNIKGANVRLLGTSIPSTPTTAVPLAQGFGPSSNIPLAHPGRSTPSTSFSAPFSAASSSLYQLLPQATASEPSLPSALEFTIPSNPTLSVLLEDSGSGSGSGSIGGERLSMPPSMSSGVLSSVARATANRESQLDPFSSSSQFSSARASQEESTLSAQSEDGSIVTTTVGSHSPSPSTSSITTNMNLLNKSRLSSSVPFSKSIGARLSQYSHYSHSSQQSQQSHVSGRSRDSRLSFEIRESDSVPTQQSQTQQFSASPPSFLQQTEHIQTQQQQQQQHQKTHHVHYQAPQHAEVSVEEPGRYAERLIEFMRGVIV